MAVKHGGRGPGHLSRWPKAAGDGGGTPTPTPSSISAPQLSFADLLAFPPVPSFSVDQTAHEWEDSIQVQISLTDYTFAAPDYDELFALTDPAPWSIGAPITDPDEPFWRCRIVRRPGEPDEEVSEWCTVIQTGSTTALAITSDLSPVIAEGVSNATYTATADGPVKAWHLEGDHIHLVDFDTETGVVTLLESPTDYEWRFKYDLRLRVQGVNDVLTWEDLTIRIGNTDEPSNPTVWSTNYKYIPLVLSNGDRTVTAVANNDGQQRKVISTQKRTGNRYFEALIGHQQTSANYIWIGVTNNQEGLDFNGGGTPGVGTTVVTGLGQAYPGTTGTISGTNAAYGWVEGDVMCFQVSPAFGKFWRKKNGGAWDGDPEAGTGGTALPAGMTDYHIYVGIYRVLGGDNVVTLRTQTSQFSYSPTASYSEFV